jgi:hypothetical protein
MQLLLHKDYGRNGSVAKKLVVNLKGLGAKTNGPLTLSGWLSQLRAAVVGSEMLVAEEPKGRGTSTVESRYQATASEG